MHDQQHRPCAPAGTGVPLPQGRPRPGPFGTTLQLIVGIVGGGSLLIWLWQLAEGSSKRSSAIYTHTGFLAPPHRQRVPRHRCLPSHWHRAPGYVRLEMRSTFMGRYAVVRHEWNSRYYALGRVTPPPQGVERFEDIYGIFDGGRLAYYVFLPDQGVDGHPTRDSARLFIASQQAAPGLPSASGQGDGSPFLSASPPWETEREGDPSEEEGQERQGVC